MAANTTLTARPRQERRKSSTRKLRATGRTPAVIYGHGESTRLLSVDAHEVAILFDRISVENTVLQLRIEGEPAELRALVREVQVHPSSRQILHVDFYQIHAGERVEVAVPIRLHGTPAGVRAGGILHPNLSDLDIRCVAERIPEAIDVDVTALEIGDSVHVRDLVVPQGVEVLSDGDTTVCSVTHPAVAAVTGEEEEEEEVVSTSEPEVIRRRAEEAEEG